MLFPHRRPLAALSLLIALGAVAAPPERGPAEPAPSSKPRHPHRQTPPHQPPQHALPRSLELVLGPPPAGHRYVRVAADILLIAIGTGIVVDAMEDLAR